MEWKEDTRGLDRVLKNLENLISKEVKVGFFDTRYDDNNDNLYVAQVAQWMDEGVPANNIPPRPFFRQTFNNVVMGSHYKVPFKNLMVKVADGIVSPTVACKNLGEGLKVELEHILDNGSAFAPNQAAWEDFKRRTTGATDPLTYTSFMKESVQFKITRKGSEDK